MRECTVLVVLALVSSVSTFDSLHEIDVYLPHEHDVNLYYIEKQDEKFLFSCPDNQIFNTTLNTCTQQVRVNICPETPTCVPADWGNLFPYPPDCTQYIYCDQYGNEVVSSCYEGLEFNAALMECVPPAEANCPYCEEAELTTTEMITTIPECPAIPTCKSEDMYFFKPYPPDCNLYIYCNAVGSGEIRPCPTGRHFSPTELRCLPIDEAGCPNCIDATSTPLDITTTPEKITTTPEEITTTPDLTTKSTTEIITTETTIGVCPVTPECTDPMEIGFNLPYPPDCTKYIYCDKIGPGLVRKCPKDRQFSSFDGICLPPEEAMCVRCNPITTTIEPITTETTIGICPPTPTCTVDDEGMLLPYPPDCGSFIYCEEGGKGTLSDCPTGKHFSPERLRCVDPNLANCVTCEEYVPTLGSCPETPKCGSDEEGISKPYPSDCKMYIYCDGTESGELSFCRTGQEFSPSLLHCVPEVDSDCPACIKVTPEPTTVFVPTTLPICDAVPSCLSSEISFTKPYPPDCKKYIYCKAEGPGTLRNCPAYHEFDPKLLYCVPSEDSTCPECEVAIDPTTTSEPPTTTEDPCLVPTCKADQMGLMRRYPYDCAFYIYCATDDAGSQVTRKCQPTYMFDSTTNNCKPGATVVCDVCPKPTIISIETVMTSRCSNTPSCGPNDFGIMKSYPQDCSMYIYCDADGIADISSCPFGTYINELLKRCVEKNLATCEQCIEVNVDRSLDEEDPVCSPTPECTNEEDGVLLPYPSDCNKFIYCENSFGEISQCHEGYSFSAILLRCVKAEESDCQYCIEGSYNIARQTMQKNRSFWKFWEWFKFK